MHTPIEYSITTYIIVGITVLFSIKGFNDRNFLEKYLFIPYAVKHDKQGYRFLTHILLHADWMHLIFNMLALYSFGEFVEMIYAATYGVGIGNAYFVALYILGGLFSSLWPFYKNKDNYAYRSLGASGAVSAVVFAGVLFAPTAEMSLFFFPMPGWMFGIVYLAFEIWSNKRGNTGIAHDAHIGGAIFGIVYALITNIELVKMNLITLFS